MNFSTLRQYTLLACLLLFLSCQSSQQQQTLPENTALWASEQYSVYPNKVVQDSFEARAISPTEISSNYQSQANLFVSPRIDFKFSINGKDNEMPSGVDHHFNCLSQNAACQTPLIKFGQALNDSMPIPADTYLQPDTPLTIRLDMREVFEAFEKKGFYETYNGEKIYKEDFKAVYVAGGTAPLVWDFDNLAGRSELELKDADGDRIYEISLPMNTAEAKKSTAGHWKLSRDISSFPQYSSEHLLPVALYNMSLEEMLKNIEADSTFRTGAEWAGVWTRDISYSVILGMASLQPEVSRYSLMRKVKRERIIQDTGTGGAYPVSTDRIVWALAAWEIYKVTGSQQWLKEAYQIIKNSAEDDLKNAFDPNTGLMKGESSFLDWREQTYPEWMQPADIYESECLGTNAVHYQANIILSQMAEALQDGAAAKKHAEVAAQIKKGVNEFLWLADKGYYGQYLYGRNYKVLSPRSEALGEALVILYDVADADRQKQVVQNTPVTEYGIPSIYPQIPNIPPYHNNGVWPFVQAYWSLAVAKTGNEKALAESISAIFRPAALFLTNKENFVSSNGDFAGTEINSDRQLWSVAGTLGIIYKVFFGIDYEEDKLVFRPFVPKAYAAKQALNNFRYRQAVLDIELSGWGNEIKSIELDGKPLAAAEIPATLKGKHSIKIELASKQSQQMEINKLTYYVSPATPKVSLKDKQLSWEPVKGAVRYKILNNAKELRLTETTTAEVGAAEYCEYQVIALDKNAVESFASEPLVLGPEKQIQIFELEKVVAKASKPYKGFSGSGFIEVSKQKNLQLPVELNVPSDGVYAIDFRYANGNGPVNTDNKAAIRSLKQGDRLLGTIVFPQRGVEEWSDWGFTNAVAVELKKGNQQLSLTFDPVANENMNVEVNHALIDYLRLTKLR